MGTSGQVVQGQVPLIWLQVDVIRPLPSSEGYEYAIMCVDMATGLLAASCMPPRSKSGDHCVAVLMSYL